MREGQETDRKSQRKQFLFIYFHYFYVKRHLVCKWNIIAHNYIEIHKLTDVKKKYIVYKSKLTKSEIVSPGKRND